VGREDKTKRKEYDEVRRRANEDMKENENTVTNDRKRWRRGKKIRRREV
jgi:hypothetical protein